MTTASELFYTRRSRLGRAPASSFVDLGFDSSPHRSFHRLCSRRHHQNRDHDHTLLHRRQERDSDSLSLGGRLSSLDNNSCIDIFGRIRNQPGFSERLPGPVLHARERLLQRLRGVSLTESRLINRPNLETEIQVGPSLGSTPYTALSFQGDQIPVLQEPWKKKPPGLSVEALNSLKVEVFSCRGEGIDGVVSQLPQDCSICLESFREGDGLICLACEHSFHSMCLSSWLRCCGDCPYCRKIVAQEDDAQRRKITHS